MSMEEESGFIGNEYSLTILSGLAIIVAKPSVMGFMANDTASTHFLSIVNRLYSNRDRILAASKRLIEL